MALVEQLDLFEAAGLDAEAPGVYAPAGLDPELASHRLGSQHEKRLELSGERKQGGVYYTPPDVVENLLTLALDPLLDACGDDLGRLRGLRVLDPACGSGNFLSAAGDRIRQRLEAFGLPRLDAAAVAFGECLVGIDIDQAAVDLCVRSLSHASQGTATAEVLRGRILCADALEVVAEEGGLFATQSWHSLKKHVGAAEGFDLVIGNPPFLSQLATDTTRSEAYTARLRQRFGPAVAGLTDTAVLFLLLAVEAANAADGVVCLIQPMSVISTRDAAAAREVVIQGAGMRSVWICEDKVFDASVRVFAPVLVRGQSPAVVDLLHNRCFSPVGSVAQSELHGPTWSVLLAATKGVPQRQLRVDGTLRDVASATADYRDQYYGLRGCVIDAEDADEAEFPPLVTSGLLDPAHVLWGSRSTKFDKMTFQYPRVDIGKLEPRLQDWARSRLRPKLMLATQTKVLEVFVDASGRYVPSVPVLTISAQNLDDLWCVGALLSSPPVTLLAARRHLGAALSSEALKLSASEVLDLPLPINREAWREAAKCFERATCTRLPDVRLAELTQSAKLMCEAFGLKDDAELMAWWADRLPIRHVAR